ncbi:T6SS immunity protein Tdi1 domain-containing protein [Larkinella rosea]|nr:T6SS immunity protein Tdi1 domain-containing protein [Larkinella rosea]
MNKSKQSRNRPIHKPLVLWTHVNTNNFFGNLGNIRFDYTTENPNGMMQKGLKTEVSEELKRMILKEWAWLIGTDKVVVAITNLGDAFFSDKSGWIYWLDTGSGELEKVADSLGDFDEYLADPETSDVWLLSNLLNDLEAAGIHCQEHEVYSPKHHPLIGGEYKADNFYCIDALEHFSLSSSIHFQIKDLPDGTPIQFTISR